MLLSLASLAFVAAACPSGYKSAGFSTFWSYPKCCPNSPNYDSKWPKTECSDDSGCKYEGEFEYHSHATFPQVKSAHNIISFFATSNNKQYGNKQLEFKSPDGAHTFPVEVYDTCSDKDCGGCCTKNTRGTGFLIDMEVYTYFHHFNITNGDTNPDAENPPSSLNTVCWKEV